MSNSTWNRTKRKRKTIEILYEAGKPTLKVLKIIGKRLASTGTPVAGGYELFPEEAVYLLETGSATICTSSGEELNILEAYGILENSDVPHWKYEIYKQIKRMGLVVLRPRKDTIRWENLRQAEVLKKEEITKNSFEIIMRLHSISAEGVLNPGSFPSFTNENGKLSVEMKVLHTDSKLVNFLPSMCDFPTSKALERILISTAPSNREKKCRPSHLPIMDSQGCSNWAEFNLKVAESEQREILKKFRRMTPLSLMKSMAAVGNVDFHVFSPCNFSHRLPAKPIFSVICASSSNPPINLDQLSQLSNVVLAIEECAKVSFMSISGGSINLNGFLKT